MSRWSLLCLALLSCTPKAQQAPPPSREGRSPSPFETAPATAANGASEAPAARIDQLERHLAALKSSLPEGFSAVIEPPFAVIGDEPPGELAAWSERTV